MIYRLNCGTTIQFTAKARHDPHRVSPRELLLQTTILLSWSRNYGLNIFQNTFIIKMIRQDLNRIDPKRRSVLGHKKKQFATAQYSEQEYKHRLNIYDVPPTAEITLEDFEKWAIARLKG